MLLQSRSPAPGKRDTEAIRLFPAVPWHWHDAAFTDLRILAEIGDDHGDRSCP